MTIVDIHCHTFNADDLPVRGFVRRVAEDRTSLAKVLAWTLDKVTQGMASGAEEVAELDRLIEAGPGAFEVDEEPLMLQLDAESMEVLAELEAEHPVVVEEARSEVASDPAAPGGPDSAVEGEVIEGEEGLLDGVGDLRRYVRWAGLFGKNRLALTRALIAVYPEVDLFTPMLVDLLGLEDQAVTSVIQQLELQEKISRLGILGHFDAQVLPFVGCDPRRSDMVDLAQQAVEKFGCVGVKLYPLMGFLPFGNSDALPFRMTAEVAKLVDERLAKLFDWCAKDQVPITAHCNPTNYAHSSYKTYSSPANWDAVLSHWPSLHLNLGHFGWGDSGWPDAICKLMAAHPGLYVDIGNHELNDLAGTMNKIAQLYAGDQTKALHGRFMFGTDWFMIASHRDFEQFLKLVRAAFNSQFPKDAASFMGEAALSFLGFDDPQNHNNQRTRARYEKYGVDPPAWLKKV